MAITPIHWDGNEALLLDQRLLPMEETWLSIRNEGQMADAIRTMVIRGAPAIGVAAAFGLVLAADNAPEDDPGFLAHLSEARDLLAATRPTAVNLFWALDRMMSTARKCSCLSPQHRRDRLEQEAVAIFDEDLEMCRAIGRHGLSLLSHGEGLMTHCNAGALATAGYGTALGVFRAAAEADLNCPVYVRETRPLLQGARLTAWELMQDGIPVTLVTDSMAAHVCASGRVQRIITGADRIAANGDTANKIGTYGLAIIAREFGIPFHIAAPASTIEMGLMSGDGIPIEERAPEEVTELGGVRIAPPGVGVYNPAFDVTPARLITSIITDRGVALPPFEDSLSELLGEQ